MITSENYLENVIRTDAVYDAELIKRLTNCARLLHAAIGIATESGEFLDAIKKHIFYGKPFDRVNVIEENGDLLWYIGLALDDLSVTMNAVLTQNIEKLKLRYPNKFNGDDAINRNVEAERELLERKHSVLNIPIFDSVHPVDALKDFVPLSEDAEKRLRNICDEPANKKLSTDHWSYIEKLLTSHGEDAETIRIIEFHYTSAFEHGFKHGVESCGR